MSRIRNTVASCEFFLKKGFEILKMEKSLRADTVTFIDEEGYMYKLNYCTLVNDIKVNSYPCRFFRGNPFTTRNINLYLTKIKSPYRLIENQESKTNAQDKLKWKCKKCKNGEVPFFASWNNVKMERDAHSVRENK